MRYLLLLLVPLVPLFAAAVLYMRYRLTRFRPSDVEVIDELLSSRGLNRIAVTKHNNYWRYWIRGKLTLSNCARLYIIEAEEPGGSRREIHIAFDDWPLGSGRLQVLMDR
jgi:hypothetical protein